MFLYDLAYITKPLQNSVCPGTAYLIINRLRFPRIPVRESCLGLITGFRRSFKIMYQKRPVSPLRLCRILPVESGSQSGRWRAHDSSGQCRELWEGHWQTDRLRVRALDGGRPVLCLMDTGVRSDSFGWERVRLVVPVLPE